MASRTGQDPAPPRDAVTGAMRWEAISALCRDDLTDGEFFPRWLDEVISVTGALGGLGWTASAKRELAPRWLGNIEPTELGEYRLTNSGHLESVKKTWASGQPQVIPPSNAGDGEAPGNPTPFLLVLVPILAEPDAEPAATVALVELIFAASLPPEQQSQSVSFAFRAGALAQNRAIRHRIKALHARREIDQRLSELRRKLHVSLNDQVVAFHLVNELRRAMDCDRVTFGICRGEKLVARAVSGQESIDRRANLVRAAESLMQEAVKTRSETWYDGELATVDERLRPRIEQYLDHSFAHSLAVIPIMRDSFEPSDQPTPDSPRLLAPNDHGLTDKCLGVLMLEAIESSWETDLVRDAVDELKPDLATSLANSIHHSRLFLMPLWRQMARVPHLFRGSARNKSTAMVAAVLILAGVLFLWPAELKVAASGQLLPESRRHVFAKTDGVVSDILVETGAEVVAGDHLLYLVSPELDVRINETMGQLAEAEEKYVAILRQRHRAREAETQEKARLAREQTTVESTIASLRTELDILNQKAKQLTVSSDISGVVTTWNVKELLANRPVTPGQQLLTVAQPDGKWELELKLPIRHLAHFQKALVQAGPDKRVPVTYVLESHPTSQHQGWLIDFLPVAEADEDVGTYVLLRVATDMSTEEHRELRTLPGTSVIGKVHCGHHSLGYCKLHEAIEWWQRFSFKWL